MAKMTATETAPAGDRSRRSDVRRPRRASRARSWSSLYREIRALRIYEGATEVQKLIVAREVFRSLSGETA